MIEMFQVTFFKYDQNQLIIDANSRSKNKWEFTQKNKKKKEMFENCDECIYDLVQLR